jgi:hypothetical protein
MVITPWDAPLGDAWCRYRHLRGCVLLYALRGSIFGRRQGFKSPPPFPARVVVPTTFLIRCAQLLTNEDADVGEALTSYFCDEGIHVTS